MWSISDLHFRRRTTFRISEIRENISCVIDLRSTCSVIRFHGDEISDFPLFEVKPEFILSLWLRNESEACRWKDLSILTLKCSFVALQSIFDEDVLNFYLGQWCWLFISCNICQMVESMEMHTTWLYLVQILAMATLGPGNIPKIWILPTELICLHRCKMASPAEVISLIITGRPLVQFLIMERSNTRNNSQL